MDRLRQETSNNVGATARSCGGFSHGIIVSRTLPSLSAGPSARLSQQRVDSSKKKTSKFTLGGSSRDDESSFKERMSFHPRHSSLLEGLIHDNAHAKKQTSFREEVESRTIQPIREGTNEDEDAIENYDEEDDDSSDWEDSVSESGRSSPLDDKQLFQRVD
jgi:hypothetical protein